jgi:NTP pyrophosphatase (non-canonical NTP hydrolase)
MSSDNTTTVAELREIVRVFVRDREWEQFHNPKDLASAIAIEAAELMELYLWLDASEASEREQEETSRLGLEHELADILILCLSMANRMNIDLSTAILEKVRLNAEKYPVHRARGRAHKYTEYVGEAQSQDDSPSQ